MTGCPRHRNEETSFLRWSPQHEECMFLLYEFEPLQIWRCECVNDQGAAHALYPSGDFLEPILSVVSMGTRQPFKKRLSRLNQEIARTSLRVIVVP